MINKCKLIFYVREERPPFHAAAGRCETHNIEVAPPYGADTQCAIGRIEQAVEDGLAKIAKNK